MVCPVCFFYPAKMGDCRNSFFLCFLPFLAKKVVPDSRFSEARFFQGQLFDFLQKIWNGWPAKGSRFFGLPDPDFQISRFPARFSMELRD